ncbi:MAG: RIP metalloprotease RseP [Magnetospiraceae bacterium]
MGDLLTFINDYLVTFLFILTVAVFFHELGHYAVARWNGVRVDVFSIGFGPELFGWNDKAGTRWKVSAIPLGGYIRMFGEGMEEGSEEPRDLTEEEKKVSFHHKRLGQRAAVVAAGPIANLILAIVVFFGVYSVAGIQQVLPVVADVVEGSPAEAAGLQSGDKILSISGEPIQYFTDLARYVGDRPRQAVVFEVARQDQVISIDAVLGTRENAATGSTQGFIGIHSDPTAFEVQDVGILEAASMSVEQTALAGSAMLGGLMNIIFGAADPSELGGPIRIAQISGEVAKGGIVPVLHFLAFLSINLFLINLFPIPVLDGGHLLFYAIEGVRGRPLGPTAQEYGFRFGLVLVFALMIFATFNDLVMVFSG